MQGNEQVSDMIKRGERLIAVARLIHMRRKTGRTDIHQDDLPADGVFIIPSPTAIIKGSPNPNAAKLFAQYMLSDKVQALFPEAGGYAARSDIAPPKGSRP